MLEVCIVSLLLKLAVNKMVSKVLLVRCARGLVEGIGATSHVISESCTCKEGRLGLWSHWEKVGRSLILSVSIVCP